MKGYKVWVIVFVVMVMGIGIAMRIYTVNTQTEEIPCRVYKFGEQVALEKNVMFGDLMEGYSITVKEADLISTEEFMEKYNCTLQDLPECEYMPQIYDLEIEIANENNLETGIDLFQLYLQNESALVGFDPIYYRLANAEDGIVDTSIAVKPGTSARLRIVFPVPELNFSAKAYKNLRDLDMKLVVTLYPEKKMIGLQ